MNFFDKLFSKVTKFIKYLMNHKVWLLVSVPLIAAIVVAVIFICRENNTNDPETNPEQTTSATTSNSVETTLQTTTQTTTETSSIESLPGTLGSTDSEAETTTEATTEEPAIPDFPLLTENTEILGIHETTEDGIVLMTGELSVPVFRNPNSNPAIAVINEDIYNYVNELRAEIIRDCRPVAENDLTSDSPAIPFNCEVTYEVTLSSDTTVSILFSKWVYTGGETSSLHRESITYTVSDGIACTLDDLFGEKTADATELIKDSIIAEISAAPEEFYPDYEGLVNFYDLESRWYLSETGFTVYYIPYELAGYAKGVLTYTIPLGDLHDYLLFNPAYTSFAE